VLVISGIDNLTCLKSLALARHNCMDATPGLFKFRHGAFKPKLHTSCFERSNPGIKPFLVTTHWIPIIFGPKVPKRRSNENIHASVSACCKKVTNSRGFEHAFIPILEILEHERFNPLEPRKRSHHPPRKRQWALIFNIWNRLRHKEFLNESR